MPRRQRDDVMEAVEGCIKLHMTPSEIGRTVSARIARQIAGDPDNGVEPRPDVKPISERQVTRYVNKVYARLEQDAVQYTPMRRNQMRQSLEAVYQRAMKKGDLRSAVMALDRIAKLDGLYAAEKVDHSVSGTVEHAHQHDERAKQMTTDERRTRITELFDQYAAKDDGTNGAGTNGSGNGHDIESDPSAAN